VTSPLGSLFRLFSVYRPVFFCLRPEHRQGRAHPPRGKVGGRIVCPTLFLQRRIPKGLPAVLPLVTGPDEQESRAGGALLS